MIIAAHRVCCRKYPLRVVRLSRDGPRRSACGLSSGLYRTIRDDGFWPRRRQRPPRPEATIPASSPVPERLARTGKEGRRRSNRSAHRQRQCPGYGRPRYTDHCRPLPRFGNSRSARPNEMLACCYATRLRRLAANRPKKPLNEPQMARVAGSGTTVWE